MPGVCFVKRPVEAAEEGSHGQVHAPVSIIDRRVDEHGVTSLVAKKVAAPQIDCMTEQGSNSVGTERRSRAQPWRGALFQRWCPGPYTIPGTAAFPWRPGSLCPPPALTEAVVFGRGRILPSQVMAYWIGGGNPCSCSEGREEMMGHWVFSSNHFAGNDFGNPDRGCSPQ